MHQKNGITLLELRRNSSEKDYVFNGKGWVIKTQVFHKVTQDRASKNAIKKLINEEGVVITDLEDLKKMATNYYRDFLQSQPVNYETVTTSALSELLDYYCSETEAMELLKPVNAEEIRKFLFSMPKSKAWGPDGYTVEFYNAV